jgi:uncharacterized protein YndB with AHSA1/START domain
VTSVTLVRRIAARPTIVFDAISTPQGITAWWGPDAGPVLHAEMDLRVGGDFKVRFRTLDGIEHECRGTVIEATRPERLSLTWHWRDGEAEGESRVEFQLRILDGGTELTLTHALLPSEEAAQSHQKGWSGALAKLENLLNPTEDRRLS